MLHVPHIILTVYSVVDQGQDAEKQNGKTQVRSHIGNRTSGFMVM